MSEVEDRAQDTEVDVDNSERQNTERLHSETPSHSRRKDGINGSKPEDDTANTGQNSEEVDDEADSEAETLIQSPEKRRSIVDGALSLPHPNGEDVSRTVSPHLASALGNEVHSRKRKRSAEDGQDTELSPNPSRRSSPLSSPVAFAASIDSDSDHQNRRKTFKSDSVKLKRNGARDRSRESEARAGLHSVRKRRPSDIIPHKLGKHMDNAERRETRSATYSRHSDDERSPSPQPIPRREHRRGVSTQLTAHEFGVKKRGRPPLINTRRNRSAERAASVSSDDSNSPAPPRSAIAKHIHSEHDTMSPAKTGPRKWRDKNGRTFLARACNNNDLESAKARLTDRPEDLNWADNAGNTPLQIAALEGFVDIVQFLLEAGCDVDTRNIDRETPLIDAVENGHVEVVKLLLDHGANPRLGNAKGDEPYELVPQDDENYEEIRALLAEAKEREGRKHRAHEQVEAATREGGESSRAPSATSQRDSPPMGPRSPPTLASRRRTGRSESTRNDLLWQANTQENLTKLAGKGDVQGVASILNILQKAETESLIAAAKAGHEEVLQYLLGMGDPEPDPDPVRSLKPGYNTPILAAIGRGHVDVVKLLVNQSGFNPTRKYRDKTYFDLSRERKGEDWQQEHDILKAAYDNYPSSKGRKTSSPRKTRDPDKSKPRLIRRSSSTASQKRVSSSPTVTHKSLSSNKSSDSSPKDKRKVPDIERRKISGGRPDMGDNSVAVASDLDQTVTIVKKTHHVRRSQSDLPAPSKMEPETTHRRRRLVTGKEHRRNKSTAPESESDEDAKEVIVVKQEEKPTPNLKRARSRSSMSPERKQPEDVDKSRYGPKKRRTVLESSPDEARHSTKNKFAQLQTEGLVGIEALTQSIEVPKQEENVGDVEMSNADEEEVTSNTEAADIRTSAVTTKAADDDKSPKVDPTPEEIVEKTTDQPDPPQDVPAEPSTADQETTAMVEDAAEIMAKEQSAREAKLEAERLAKIEAEQIAAAMAEAEARRVEAAQKAAEEEKMRLAAEQRKAEEAENRRKAEEEAILRKKEEEDRQERIRQEMEDRRRQQQYLESERLRRDALPITLGTCSAMVDANDGSAHNHAWLKKFLPLYTVKTLQLDPTVSPSVSEERWVPNFQVACLLATKDLNLRNYTSFERRKATSHERICMWRVTRNMLSFEYNDNSINTSIQKAMQREDENRPKFFAMEELFWVKLSDFTDQVFRHPHLLGLKLTTRPISLLDYSTLPNYSSPQNRQSTQSTQVNGSSLIDAKLVNGIHNPISATGDNVEHDTK